MLGDRMLQATVHEPQAKYGARGCRALAASCRCMTWDVKMGRCGETTSLEDFLRFLRLRCIGLLVHIPFRPLIVTPF